MSRWKRTKRWIVKKSKSKPAQLCLSVASGGSLASGMFIFSGFLLSYLETDTTAYVALKGVQYLLTSATFLATTALAASNLSVSISNAGELSQQVKKITNQLKHSKLIQRKQKEAIDYLVQNNNNITKTNTEHFTAIKQLLGVADIFTKHVPDKQDQLICETALLPLSEGLKFSSGKSIVVIEPYFDEENPAPISRHHSSSDDSDSDDSEIELLAMNPSQTQHRAQYGTLFSASSSQRRNKPANQPIDSDLDLESGSYHALPFQL